MDFASCLLLLNFLIIVIKLSEAKEAAMDIGLKLKELRILKGLTQEELADRAELSKGFISQVERNLTSPSIATLMDILQCLGASTADFFTSFCHNI